MRPYDTETIEHNGHTYRVEYHFDEGMGAPWEEHDGHGPVSDWTSRAKAPGEIVLSADHGSKRYYDFAEACRIARRDGWGWLPGKLATKQINETTWQAVTFGFVALGSDINEAIRNLYASHRATMSARAYAAAAARKDFEYLQRWCNDEWHWCGLVVTMLDDEGEPIEGAEASLWGMENDSREYLMGAALELAEEATPAA